MDQFEARLRFLTILQHLNTKYDATPPNAIKFLIKHSQYEEDLYSCIQETLDQAKDLKHRLSLFYFIESLCIDTAPDSSPIVVSSATSREASTSLDADLDTSLPTSNVAAAAATATGTSNGGAVAGRPATKPGQGKSDASTRVSTNDAGGAVTRPQSTSYHSWIIQDLYKIVGHVVPVPSEDANNNELLDTNVNIQQVRFALQTFLKKQFISATTFQELNELLKTREERINSIKKSRKQGNDTTPLPNKQDGNDSQSYEINAVMYDNLLLRASSLAPEEVQRRMNGDRERTKKSRELLWEVEYSKEKKYAEFEYLWDVVGSGEIQQELPNNDNKEEEEEEDDEDDDSLSNYGAMNAEVSNKRGIDRETRADGSKRRKQSKSREMCIKRGILTTFDFEKMAEENAICLQTLGEERTFYFNGA